MKKTIKIMLLVFILLSIFTLTVNAAKDPSQFTGNESADVTKITNLGNSIITIVSTVGSIVSVIVLVILGLKYMMGSAEEKAEYKKTLLPYIIGAALVFAASSIAGIIFSFTTNL